MDAEIRPGADFYAAVARLKGAPPEIRKKLNAEIRSATKPIERAAKQSVLGIESRGSAGGGRAIRGGYNISKSAKAGAKKGTGLRETVARAIQTKITYSGFRTGVRVRVDGTKLPESQRSLPRAMNKGRVRHPVFGDRNVWTNQTFAPPGWFTRVTSEGGAEAIQKIKAAAKKALNELG